MSFPKVQTALAHKLTNYVNEKYGTDLSVKKVDLSYAGQVKLEDVFIKDTRKDTIIFVNKLQTSILDFNRLLNGKTDLGVVAIENATVIMRTYKGETKDELQVFISSFDSKKPSGKPSKFLLTSDLVKVDNARFTYYRLSSQEKSIVSYQHISGQVEDFKIQGPNIYGNVRNMKFVDQNGLVADEMRTDFTYTKTNMIYKNTYLRTPYSELEGDILMSYEKKGLSDFKNNVHIEAYFPKADISLKDARTFYDELGTDDVLHFSTKMSGTLNDFTTKELKLTTDQNAVVNGDIRFINSFNSGKDVEVIADISHLESDYNHLKKLLPNLLGKTLPSSFKTLGHFSMKGRSHITNDFIKAKLTTNTEIGKFESDLVIKNYEDIDNAGYEGNLIVSNLPLGKLVNDPLMGEFSMNVDVKGKGFTLDNLDTQIKGKILQHQYNNYTYTNITVNGKVKDKLFEGNFVADDPNLKLSFEGLADLSQTKNKFDFFTHVDYADFNKLNLLSKDSISILKGDIKMAMIGNKLENMQGSIIFKDSHYINENQDFSFGNFIITSSIKDSIQTIKIDSKDIVKGKIKGKFLFEDLGKLALNAAGSIYTNYKPQEVSSGQHLSFNFKVYNKILAVFFPDVILGKNTSFRGLIDSDKQKFKLTFKSPEIAIDQNIIEKIKLQIDNKNPLFNTQLSVDKLTASKYEISDFNLVNITLNDTLHFRSEFKGGKSKRDNYDLSFYHTISKDGRSILGFKESEITIGETVWKLNPDNDSNNKILYDALTGKLDYKDFRIQSGEQGLSFYGEQEGDELQTYNLDLDRINLSEIIPELKGFDFDGLLNGGIWIEKRNGMLIPTADIQLLDLTINKELQGDLIGEIRGTESNKDYSIDLYLEKNGVNTITTKGVVKIDNKKPIVAIDVNFENFQIDMLNSLGEGVMENIRGDISGDVKLTGLLENPNFSGDLSANNVGMYFPYINVDYSLENGSRIALSQQAFTFLDATIFDTYLNTKGNISGSISHSFFKQWFLDLNIETDNLLAINTPEDEDALFYGTGYLSGTASISGNTDNINIAINGSSNQGTEIIIPMSDIKTIESSNLIHYKTPENDTSIISYQEQLKERFKGVTMDFNLDINKDATIEFIIDQNTGSALRGNGTGNIQMDIDTKGTFNMYGEYVVDKGFYIFKYGLGIINKVFDVKQGGTISFGGDPYKAELDIEAVYKTKANPQVLLSEYEAERDKDIPVELTTKITGELFNSTQEFGIEVPNAPLSLASELDFVLNDQDDGNMMIQFVSLLVLGSFIDNDNLVNSGVNGVNEGLNNAASVMISNAIVSLFSDPDDIINFGFEYTTADRVENPQNIINNSNQLEVSAQAKLGKNKRISINGEVYVPTGAQSNNNIAGTASIEFPLNENESILAKVFQRKAEIQYTPEEDYIRGVGISWHVNFNSISDLIKQTKSLKQRVSKKDSIIKKEAKIVKKEPVKPVEKKENPGVFNNKDGILNKEED